MGRVVSPEDVIWSEGRIEREKVHARDRLNTLLEQKINFPDDFADFDEEWLHPHECIRTMIFKEYRDAGWAITFVEHSREWRIRKAS